MVRGQPRAADRRRGAAPRRVGGALLVADRAGRAPRLPRAGRDLRPHAVHQGRGQGTRRAGLPAAPGGQRRRQAGRRDRLHGDALAARRDHVRPDDHAAGGGPLLGRHRRRRGAPRRRVDAPPPARRRLGRPHRPHLVAVLPGRLGPAGARPRRRRAATTTSPTRRSPTCAPGRCTSATSPCRALRVSYVGELGWEIYAPAEFGRGLWDTLCEAGRVAGRGGVRRRRLRLAAPGEGLPAVGPGHRRGARPLRGRPGLGRAAGQGRGLHRPRGRGRDQGARRHAAAVLPGHRRPRGHARRQGAAARRRAPGRLRHERRLRRDAGREHRLRLPAGRAAPSPARRSPCTAPAPTTA